VKDKVDGLKSLGQAGVKYDFPTAPYADVLEFFENQFPDRSYHVRFRTEELTSLCPKTGQPDFASIDITYTPNKRCVESKSLKLYLFSYRTAQTFMETLTNQILEDLVQLLDPHWIHVKGLFASRGGIRQEVEVEYTSNNHESILTEDRGNGTFADSKHLEDNSI